MTGTLSVKLAIGQTVKLRSVNDEYPDYFVSLKSLGADNRVVISNSGVDNEWILRSGLSLSPALDTSDIAPGHELYFCELLKVFSLG